MTPIQKIQLDYATTARRVRENIGDTEKCVDLWCACRLMVESAKRAIQDSSTSHADYILAVSFRDAAFQRYMAACEDFEFESRIAADPELQRQLKEIFG